MSASKYRQCGHTLLELSISVALGVLIVLATISLYRGQRFAYDHATETTRLRDAASTALDLIGQQVQMAGFVPAGAGNPDKSPPLFGCSPGRPTGSDAAPVCEALASRSDGIVVRYAADTISTWPSSSGSPTDCLGQISAGEWIVNRYYAKASSSTVEPELYCEGSGKPGTGQPLVEGIERIKFGYWLKDGRSLLKPRRSRRTAGRWSSPWTCAYSCEETVRARRLARVMPIVMVRRSFPPTVASGKFSGAASHCAT